MKPVHSFIVTAKLPEKIEKLKEIAYNYWWCWNSDAKELFNRMNRQLWQEVGHNPVLLINKLHNDDLVELSEKPDYVAFLDYVYSKYQDYLKAEAWYETHPGKQKGAIAYFSTEYGINESFPNYSGGLGVLSGDHLKSSSDLGLPLIGVGLLYQQGYFRQHLTQHGWQNEIYPYNDFYSMPLILEKDEKGNPIEIIVELPYGKAFAQIWKLQIGRVPLYLMDTNIKKNGIEEYRDITDQLYGGTRETRIQQEIVLGIGGMRALKALGLEPDIIHINEGHAAFALLERTRMYMEQYGMEFREAKEITKSSSIFTTHTPVPAGNEVFRLGRMDNYFNKYYSQLGLSREEFLSYGHEKEFNADENFSMTILGLKLTCYHNGVSKLHGEVARKMWQDIWQCFPTNEVPIKHITNGIHTMTWLARDFAELFDRYLNPAWQTETDNQLIWDKTGDIPNEELWREKQRNRTRLVLFAREYLKNKQKAFMPPEQVSKIGDYLNPDALTIGFARRFATYKRALLLFSDMERLKKILTSADRPIQILLAGKAHPHDNAGKEMIQGIINNVRQYGLENHVVFLEDYDMVIARYLVKGCDIWLNNPVRPQEASGTSGMKAAINGTVNFSILDGWWDESYNGKNGFAIGQGEEFGNPEEREIIEAGELYNVLEQQIIPIFYERSGHNKTPNRWAQYMKESIKSVAGNFSTTRMIKEYSEKFYFPALNNFKKFTDNDAAEVRKFRIWKDKVRQEWKNVEVLGAKLNSKNSLHMDEPVEVTAEVNLGGLGPKDVEVQVYYGEVEHTGNLINTSSQNLDFVKSEGKKHLFKGSYVCPDNGIQGFTVRILPKHPMMVNQSDLYLCSWAKAD